MRIVLLAVVGLMVVIVAIVVIGFLIPKRHVAARSISLRQRPDEVFALISDFKTAPTWRPDVQQVEILAETNGHLRFRETGKNGALTMEVIKVDPPHSMITQIADKSLPFGGSWIFEISPTPEGCQLNITERGEIYNPVFRFVSRFLLGYNSSLDKYLHSVSRKFGESAPPVEGKAASQKGHRNE